MYITLRFTFNQVFTGKRYTIELNEKLYVTEKKTH